MQDRTQCGRRQLREQGLAPAQLLVIARLDPRSLLERAAAGAACIPGAIRAMYAVMERSVAVRQRIGSVAVTSVGMFAGGGGFGLTPMTLMTLEVVVGGMTRRPRVVSGHIDVRDVLDLTVAIDHDVVGGAPATRFVCQAPGIHRERCRDLRLRGSERLFWL